MKKLITTIALCLVATNVSATTNVADLTNDEQAAVRLGECDAMWGAAGSTIRNSDRNQRTLLHALTSPGQKFGNYGDNLNKIYRDSRQDSDVAIALGDLIVNPASVAKCGEDLKDIAKDDYKPSFSKPTKTVKEEEVVKETKPVVSTIKTNAAVTRGKDMIVKLSGSSTEIARDKWHKVNQNRPVSFTGTVKDADVQGWILGDSIKLKSNNRNVSVTCQYKKDIQRAPDVGKGQRFTCKGSLGNYTHIFGSTAITINAK